MKLILLRHGMTMANEAHLYCGATDIGLSENGLAELLSLKEEFVYPDAFVYLTSGMQRADQTLNTIYGRMADKRLSCFAEMNFGKFEMKSYEQLKEADEYKKWISDIHTLGCPNGESEPEFFARLEAGLSDIFQEYQNSRETILLVAHGGVIAWTMERFFPNVKNYYEWQPRNGRGYILTFVDDFDIQTCTPKSPIYEAIPLAKSSDIV